MTLPNGDKAQVPQAKLSDYVLNPAHPEGAKHARLFLSLLGIGPAQADVLRSALLDAAASREASPGRSSSFGTKYEIRFPMTGPRGSYTVLSVWIIPGDSDRPRLVTAYVE